MVNKDKNENRERQTGEPEKKVSPAWRIAVEFSMMMRPPKYREMGEKREGPHKVYHANGQLGMEVVFKNGEPQGTAKMYYENGQLGTEAVRKDGTFEWQFRDYYESGQLKGEGCLKDGKPEGLWKQYYPDGQLQLEESYKDGQHDGPFKGYFANGKLENDAAFKAGVAEGLWRKYYVNGQLEMERFFKDGKREGAAKTYYEDGQVRPEVFQQDEKKGLKEEPPKNKPEEVFDAKGLRKNVVKDGVNLVKALIRTHTREETVAYFKRQREPNEAELIEINRLLDEWEDYENSLTENM